MHNIQTCFVIYFQTLVALAVSQQYGYQKATYPAFIGNYNIITIHSDHKLKFQQVFKKHIFIFPRARLEFYHSLLKVLHIVNFMEFYQTRPRRNFTLKKHFRVCSQKK